MLVLVLVVEVSVLKRKSREWERLEVKCSVHSSITACFIRCFFLEGFDGAVPLLYSSYISFCIFSSLLFSALRVSREGFLSRETTLLATNPNVLHSKEKKN